MATTAARVRTSGWRRERVRRHGFSGRDDGKGAGACMGEEYSNAGCRTVIERMSQSPRFHPPRAVRALVAALVALTTAGALAQAPASRGFIWSVERDGK